MTASIRFTHIDEYHDAKVRNAWIDAKENAQTCPVCMREVSPANFDRHNETYHKDNPVTFVRPGGFDFNALDVETRITVIQEDKEFDQNMADAGTKFIRACHNIRRIHEALRYKRPGFKEYYASKRGLSERTAYKMLAVARMCAENAQILADKEALYLLAKPTTTDEQRQIALDAAEAGERLTNAKAKSIVEKHNVTYPETIARIVVGVKRKSEWVEEADASGYIQPGDESEATPITATPPEIDATIGKRQQNHKIIGAQASGKPYTPPAETTTDEPTAPAFILETQQVNGLHYAVIRYGGFATNEAALDGGEHIMRLYATWLSEQEKEAKEARKAQRKAEKEAKAS